MSSQTDEPDRVALGGLRVAPVLHAFVRDEALPGSGLDEAAFWTGRSEEHTSELQSH